MNTTHTLLLFVLACTLSLTAAGGQDEITIGAEHHPLGESLRAVLAVPDGAGAKTPVPACVIVHGSGGLFRENAPGEACGPGLESNFRRLAELFEGLGVAALLPSSFASRDARFCEDNDDDYLQYAPAPFFNDGDGAPTRDSFYKIRRVVIRTLDLMAASDYLCQRGDIDCDRVCLVGTSNGGTAILGYLANDLERHLLEYTDTTTKREHETNGNFVDRQTAFANFPALPADISALLAARPLPDFAQAISPGCSLRKLVPTVEPDDPEFNPEQHLTDLYYPADPVELHLEIGSKDDVPDACHDGGIRQLQADGFDTLTGVPSRYRVEVYEGAGHNLLGERRDEVHGKLTTLVRRHFFPSIFHDRFE